LPIGSIPAARPAADYAEAIARFDALRALDDACVLDVGKSTLYAQPSSAPLAIVLLHGFTSCPQQYAVLAAQLQARGHSIVVPRLPGHGDIDRSGPRLVGKTAEQWLATAGEALDIACGLGQRVATLGISLGGAMGAWFALQRRDIARAVAVVPMFGIDHLGPFANTVLRLALTTLPNLEIRWDPFGDQKQIPAHAYPRYPSRGLGQCLRIGAEVAGASRTTAPLAGDVVAVLNTREPAISNKMALQIVENWQRLRANSASTFIFDNLAGIHDIVEPTNPYQHIDIAYPKFIELLEGAAAVEQARS
jgi:carboxylesterase